MPFVLRVVEPVYLSRKSLHHANGTPKLKDGELEAVTNNTLAGAVRQLASLVLVAQDIFDELNRLLNDVGQRSKTLCQRIAQVEKTVNEYDPKRVTVPEGDLSAFSRRSRPFRSARPAAAANLFDASSRPTAICRLYAAAAAAPALLESSARDRRELLCTPVLGRSRLGRLRAGIADMDIETRVPAAVGELRRWTSAEALGNVTVCPDGWTRISSPPPEDHHLPTTEEQLKAIADRFPAETVAVDVTGRGLRRMAQCRRSLIHVEQGREGGRRRLRPRRDRNHRRNTLAGTDQREIQRALDGANRIETCVDVLRTVDDMGVSSEGASRERERERASEPTKRWHLNSLRRWKARLRAINGSASGELRTAEPVDDINVYEAVAPKVKLREGSVGQRRKGPEEPPHSSSGNWSASSESGRASVTSESSHQPKSSTCSSVLPQRRRFVNHSTSSSVTSEGTLTPEDMHAHVPFADDAETSSAYSCDTEGYYTSFHVDSGLKTLKEEETQPCGLALPQTPMHSTTALSNCSSGRGSANLGQLSAESEYELFGKGSTSTTTSSAGTVCTTLLVGSNRSLTQAPAVPERKSSLQGLAPPSDSPDSGHNTDSVQDAIASPIPSISSEMEFSESSDLEGVDRLERIRVKTTINSSRIPSMCVITPPPSDDEVPVVDNSSADVANNNNIKSDVDNNNTPQHSVDPEAGRKLVSLEDLPVRKDTPPLSAFLSDSGNESLERKRRIGARVMLDAEGKVVYSSDSLRRRKGAHTTFEPGPFVKEPSDTSPLPSPTPTPTPSRVAGRTPKAIIRPVNSQQRVSTPTQSPAPSPSRIVIRAAGGESPMRMMHASTPTSHAAPPSLDCSGALSPIVKSSLIAPPKSTMTAEQLYAVIHKSKKQMNIRSEPNMAAGAGQTASATGVAVVAGVTAGPSHSHNSSHSYSHSRSPSPSHASKPNTVTSRYDFKRLLSQHGTAGTHKLSAVERLKVRSSGAPPPIIQTTPKKWRRLACAQRSDILSSTIVEDAAAEDQGNEDRMVIQRWTSSPMPARNLSWSRKSSLETAL